MLFKIWISSFLVYPTYGKLIDLLEEVEVNSSYIEISTAEVLASRFCSEYPHLTISRPGRFYDTVQRIAAPTRPSSVGEEKLKGSPLSLYMKRVWKPRTRNIIRSMWVYHVDCILASATVLLFPHGPLKSGRKVFSLPRAGHQLASCKRLQTTF